MHVPARRSPSWPRLSLPQQLLLLAVLPAILATTAVLVVTTLQYLRGLEALIQANAQTLAYQLAASAEAPLETLDRRALLRIARTGAAQPNTQGVRIWSAEGELMAHAESGGAPAPQGLEVAAPIADARGVATGQVVVSIDLAALRQAERTGWRYFALALGICVLAVLVGGAWAARRISAPVRRLDRAMAQLGAGEPAQVAETGPAEIRRLQQGFNRAAQALAGHRLEMEARIREATEELARKNEQIERASQARMRLLAAASHDLRQPLHALTLFSDGLARGETDPVRLQRIHHVQECVASLDHLFAELMNLTQLDAGTLRPRWTRFALDRVFEDVSRTFRPLAEERGLRLVVRPTPVWVHSDFTMLSRILANLVANALHHTAEGGVLVAARRRRNGVQIDIVDTGVGIAPEHQPHVFEEFYQIDNQPRQGRTQRHGLGLGLATVQRLAQLLRIPISLQSVVGRGTCMRLRLATVAPHAPHPTAPPHGGVDALRDLRVLAIDDEPIILQGLHEALSHWGCTVLTAHSRSEALQRLDQFDAPPQVVICDLLLPGGDNGIALMQALAEHPNGIRPDTVRLLVTGETKPERLRAARASGATILCKPVAPAVLQQHISELLAARGNAAATATA
ncbi:MAG TPA: hybrid sensor histidine kinase/response regulator [Ottowia sp.]|uniref:ATP-binding response regulator n=1 Tax=Ottowia sp. TaxID=1898956 RepID=UPI002B7995BC|nr:hybrid sensor histidine kinase/response regulator [Ottowia sp.]HMN20119.1 hybrid sensor histidine kinase/response regulator [Ottowia sp.]